MTWLRRTSGIALVVAMLGMTADGTAALQRTGSGSLGGVLATAGVLGVGIPTGVWTHRECDSGLCDDAFARGFVLGATLGAGVGWLVGRGVAGSAAGETPGDSGRPRVSVGTGTVFQAVGPDDFVGLGTSHVTVTVPAGRLREVGLTAGRWELGQEVLATVVDGNGVRRPTDQRLGVHTLGAVGRFARADGRAVSAHATLGLARSRFRETVAVPYEGRERGDVVAERTGWGLHSGIGVSTGWPMPHTGLRAGFEARAEWVSASPLGALSTVTWSFTVSR